MASRLAEALRDLRARRDLSLDEAAVRTGLGRRTLVALEQAEGNPSLSTLLRLAEGYGVGLADLIGEAPAAAISVSDEAAARMLWQTDAGSHARLLIVSDVLELWSWRIAPGDVRESAPHRRGTQEIARVRRGCLVLTTGDETREVRAGEVALFDGDRPHRMESGGANAAEFELVVHEPLG